MLIVNSYQYSPLPAGPSRSGAAHPALAGDPAMLQIEASPPVHARAMSDPPSSDAFPWLRLSLEPGLSAAVARRAVAQAGGPGALLAAGPTALVAWLGPTLGRRLAAPALAEVEAACAAAQRWAQAPGQRLLGLDDPAYPAHLRELVDAPLMLYVRGEAQALSRPGLAIVGARHATPGGMETARSFAAGLAGQGWCIVSGLAAGIDAAAHLGALDAGETGGGTVAVLGTGVDRIYPARNRALAERILAAGGAVVSELPLGAPPLRGHFPRRNRLVAGCAHGVLVVEAALHSGSLITARLAAEAGREVFAIPGSIHAPLARGCHALIRDGAKLTEGLADILDELPASRPAADARPACAGPAASADPPDPAARAVLHALGHDPVHVDDLVRRCGIDAPAVQASLLMLELEGTVARLDGGRYQRLP